MSNRALGSGFDSGFDVGTSPHGLPAELPQAEQETLEVLSCHSPAKPLLTAPEVYRSEKVRSACRTIKTAAAEPHYPLVLTTSQIERIKRALSLAIDDAIEAMSDEPDAHHEIQPDIDAYNQIYSLLRLAMTWRKGGQNAQWRSDEL